MTSLAESLAITSVTGLTCLRGYFLLSGGGIHKTGTSGIQRLNYWGVVGIQGNVQRNIQTDTDSDSPGPERVQGDEDPGNV